MLEGYEEVHSAAAMAKSAGLDMIGSHIYRDSHFPHQVAAEALEDMDAALRSAPYTLPHARDIVELGEKIHAFWSIWIIDASGSATHSFPRAFDDKTVKTPLPMPIRWYEHGHATEENQTTLAQFWAQEGRGYINDTSFTMRIKATSVLEAAAGLGSAWGVRSMGDVFSNLPDMPPSPIGTPEFEAKFLTIANTCFALREQLPALEGSSSMAEELVVTWAQSKMDPVMVHAWALTLCAIIMLHGIKRREETCRIICLEGAKAMVELIDHVSELDFHHLDIMLGVSLGASNRSEDADFCFPHRWLG